MRKWLFPLLLICLAATVLVLFLRPLPRQTHEPAPAPGTTHSNSESTPGNSSPAASPSAPATAGVAIPVAAAYIAPTQAPPATVPPLPSELLNISPMTVLENMRTTFRQYASVFGGNPVGTNQEITRALMGENPKHINFLLKADGNRINSNNELVDLWGTPYFFHQLSGTDMEVRSAGPDRKMWTDDDLVMH